MDKNIAFSLIIDILNRKISELNIKLSKNESPELRRTLDELLADKKALYEGDSDTLKAVLEKYGDLINE
jgi:hypothetical protein